MYSLETNSVSDNFPVSMQQVCTTSCGLDVLTCHSLSDLLAVNFCVCFCEILVSVICSGTLDVYQDSNFVWTLV